MASCTSSWSRHVVGGRWHLGSWSGWHGRVAQHPLQLGIAGQVAGLDGRGRLGCPRIGHGRWVLGVAGGNGLGWRHPGGIVRGIWPSYWGFSVASPKLVSGGSNAYGGVVVGIDVGAVAGAVVQRARLVDGVVSGVIVGVACAVVRRVGLVVGVPVELAYTVAGC